MLAGIAVDLYITLGDMDIFDVDSANPGMRSLSPCFNATSYFFNHRGLPTFLVKFIVSYLSFFSAVLKRTVSFSAMENLFILGPSVYVH